MNPFSGTLRRIIFRHPLLYYIRYILLSKNCKVKSVDGVGCFNDVNNIDDVPKVYFEINSKIGLAPDADELEKALAIGTYLRMNIKGGHGLGLSSEETLTKMLAGIGGVCSDFSQIFNIFCFINGIKVKEWGCIDRFYKSQFGHSFNEIYSQKEQKWIAIDIHKSILFRDAEAKTLLSSVELFGHLRKNKKVEHVFFSGYMPEEIGRISYVYSKSTIPFVISNYRNNVNDYFMNRFRKYPPFIINAIIIVFRKNHDFIFVMDNYKTKLLPKSMQNLKLTSFF